MVSEAAVFLGNLAGIAGCSGCHPIIALAGIELEVCSANLGPAGSAVCYVIITIASVLTGTGRARWSRGCVAANSPGCITTRQETIRSAHLAEFSIYLLGYALIHRIARGEGNRSKGQWEIAGRTYVKVGPGLLAARIGKIGDWSGTAVPGYDYVLAAKPPDKTWI